MQISPTAILSNCVCVAIGMCAGLALASSDWRDSVAALVGATLGAAITVLGAVWHSNRQDAARRKEAAEAEEKRARELAAAQQKRKHNVTRSCFDFLTHLGQAVNDSTRMMEGAANLSEAVAPLIAQWETVEGFEPFEDLGSFDLQRMMLQLGAKCRRLESYRGSTSTHPRDMNGHPVGMGDRFGNSPYSQAIAIQQACIDALPVFRAVLDGGR